MAPDNTFQAPTFRGASVAERSSGCLASLRPRRRLRSENRIVPQDGARTYGQSKDLAVRFANLPIRVCYELPKAKTKTIRRVIVEMAAPPAVLYLEVLHNPGGNLTSQTLPLSLASPRQKAKRRSACGGRLCLWQSFSCTFEQAVWCLVCGNSPRRGRAKGLPLP